MASTIYYLSIQLGTGSSLVSYSDSALCRTGLFQVLAQLLNLFCCCLLNLSWSLPEHSPSLTLPAVGLVSLAATLSQPAVPGRDSLRSLLVGSHNKTNPATICEFCYCYSACRFPVLSRIYCSCLVTKTRGFVETSKIGPLYIDKINKRIELKTRGMRWQRSLLDSTYHGTL